MALHHSSDPSGEWTSTYSVDAKPFVAGAHAGHLFVDRGLYREGRSRRWCDGLPGPTFDQLQPHRAWTWPWFDAYRAQGLHVAIEGGCAACQALWERWNAPLTGKAAKARAAIAEAGPRYDLDDECVPWAVVVRLLRGTWTLAEVKAFAKREDWCLRDEGWTGASEADDFASVVLGRPGVQGERIAEEADIMDRTFLAPNDLAHKASDWWHGGARFGEAGLKHLHHHPVEWDMAMVAAERLAGAVLGATYRANPYPRLRPESYEEGQVWYFPWRGDGVQGIFWVSDTMEGCGGEPLAVLRNWSTGEPDLSGGTPPGPDSAILLIPKLHPLPYRYAPDPVDESLRSQTVGDFGHLCNGSLWRGPGGQEGLARVGWSADGRTRQARLVDPATKAVVQAIPHEGWGAFYLKTHGWEPVEYDRTNAALAALEVNP